MQKAIALIEHLDGELARARRAVNEPIAVVGMGCRFPGGASSPERYWRMLCAGTDAVGPVPADRWDADELYDADRDAPGGIYTRGGSFLKEDVAGFDAGFFGISPREARSMDPQQRLLLEVVWEALEHAAIPPGSLRHSQTGVFVGVGQNDYARLLLNAGELERISRFDGTGNGLCFGPGRLSHTLGLRGPSLAIDSACSSSLAAVHLACQSLRAQECDLALAGGVQLILSPEVTVFLCRSGALSPDGRCRTFDAAAGGFGRGEGCGAVVLKRLSDAEAAGDFIWGVIRGSAVNHDGASSGLTVPSPGAQAQLIQRALTVAGVAPADVSYIEAHGTGTPMGDPIEVEALASVFGRTRVSPLWIGSAKSNHGHLEAAAGVAGLIKTLLSLYHRKLPALLHFQTPNPAIPWQSLDVKIPTKLEQWPADRPALAGVSSFGFGGTNSHVVVEGRGTAGTLDTGDTEPSVLLLSARTPSALRALAAEYALHWEQHPELTVRSVCRTAARGRDHFPHRLAILIRSRTEACGLLTRVADGEQEGGWRTGQVQGSTPGGAAGADTLEEVASDYVMGGTIDWDRWFPKDTPPVTLPTYPFERERHWVERPERAAPRTRRASVALHEISWKRHEMAAEAPKRHPSRTWLVLCDGSRVGDAVADELEMRGQQCTRLRPEEESSMPAMLAGMNGPGFGGVIHAWTELSLAGTGDRFEQIHARSSAMALRIFQTLRRAGTSGRRVWLLTAGGQAVEAGERPVLWQALIPGLGRALSLEWPELWGGLHDLSHTPGPAEIAGVVGDILHPSLDQAAWRGTSVWCPRLQPRMTRLAGERLSLRADATYLVTGGLGFLGQHLARRLAKRGAGRLILSGRRPPSPEAATLVEELRGMGCEVLLHQGDCADSTVIRDLVRDAEASGRPLRGVYHVAGNGGQCAGETLNALSLREICRAKVEGAWNLHEATRELPLDHFVLFSSIASVWGSKGQAHYAAANHFLDTLAHHRKALGLPALSIDWGPWLGGGLTDTAALETLQQMGLPAIDPSAALDALEALLHEGTATQVVAAQVEWPRFLALFDGYARSAFFQDILPAESPASAPAPVVANGHTCQPGNLQTWLVDELSSALALPAHRIDRKAPLLNLGLDSRMAVDLRNGLRQRWGHTVAMGELLGDISVEELVRKLGPGSFVSTALGHGDGGTGGRFKGEI